MPEGNGKFHRRRIPWEVGFNFVGSGVPIFVTYSLKLLAREDRLPFDEVEFN